VRASKAAFVEDPAAPLYENSVWRWTMLVRSLRRRSRSVPNRRFERSEGIEEMKSEKHNKKPVAPFINVTPLIDVLLVLLIIFMIILPARSSKFDARIPDKQEQDKPDDNPNLALVVTINHDGGYALNMQPAKTLDELQSQLASALDRRPTDLKAVFLKAPRTLSYGEVAKVIDVMKIAGCAPIGLQIENLDQ
jgi:biopolymer transport protein ExbD